VARQVRTGQVDINGGAFNPSAPFGGYKQSGIGRERGRYGLEEFVETKSMQRYRPAVCLGDGSHDRETETRATGVTRP
jgi:aldehyde dehydrogenase (NAD+)